MYILYVWTIACQVPLFMARILEWVTMPSPRGSSLPGIEPASLMSPALACGFLTTGKSYVIHYIFLIHSPLTY